MSINNDTSSVLVTKGNQGVAAAGATVSSLSPNQIGAFDANTNLAVDGSTPVRNFYLAVGLDTDADGTTDKLKKSAGQLIQAENIRFFDFKPHTPGRPQIMELKGYKASCDTDYALKLEFRNQQIYGRQGTVQFTHTYAIKTDCCEECEICGTGNCNEITKLMKAAINLDEKGLVSAIAIATVALTAATHGVSANIAVGAEITDANMDILVAYNNNPANKDTKVCTGLRLTSHPLKINKFCSINLKYFKPRETVMIASLAAGFDCNGSITTTQEVAFEQGSGYDVQQKEYFAGGTNGNPGIYRVSAINRVANNVEYLADKAIKYDQFALTYDQFSVAGWSENYNNLSTVIAVPATDTVTRNALVALLDRLTPASFDNLADNVEAANVDPTVVEEEEEGIANTDGVA